MISVVVLTKNDEKLLPACLESVKWADEIVVVDDASTDDTIQIAKRYTDKVYTHKNSDFSEKRNYGFEKTKGDWVLYVDSDERILEPLKNEILELVQTTQKSAFAISRKNIIFGTPVDYGPYKQDYMIRLFLKKSFVKWVGQVHEHGEFKGDLGYTKNSLLHLTHRDIDHIVLKSLAWSKIDAQLRLNAHHPPMSGWRFLRIFLTESWNQGIMRGGFFAGTVGVMDAMLQVFSLFITYVRLWELQQSKTREQVYQQIDETLLKDHFSK